jgi:putative redox protein
MQLFNRKVETIDELNVNFLHFAKKNMAINAQIDNQNYFVTMSNGKHEFFADEPIELEGQDLAPSPYDYLFAALASCTLITMKMYAQRKQWQTGQIKVQVEFAEDKTIVRKIGFEEMVSSEQRIRLIEIAKACPVHKLLSKANVIETYLAD